MIKKEKIIVMTLLRDLIYHIFDGESVCFHALVADLVRESK